MESAAMSNAARTNLGFILVVTGPSGAGKGTLVEHLLKQRPDCVFSVSATTRPRRATEADGREYFFLTQDDFLARAEQGFFLETAEVHGNLYGTPAKPMETALADGHDILLDIDTQGAAQLHARYPEAVLVFIVAPSMRELEQRLRERRSDGEREIARRLARAREEIAMWRRYDYLIVNRDVKEAIDQLEAIVQAERCRGSRLALNFPDLEVPN